MGAAVDAKLIASSPCFNVRMPVVPPGQMVILKYQEIERLAAVIDPRYRALVLVGCFCGLRIGELAGLSRRDIDLDDRRLHVRHSAVEVRGTLVLKEPKTRRDIRSIPIAPHVAVGLSEHLGRHTDRGSDAPVFPGPDGARLRPSNFRSRTWNRAVKAAELGGATPHDMRHTAVSHWIAAGVPVLNVSRWAGHSSTAFTLDRYGHLIKEDDSAFMDAVGDRAAAAAVGGGTVVPLARKR